MQSIPRSRVLSWGSLVRIRAQGFGFGSFNQKVEPNTRGLYHSVGFVFRGFSSHTHVGFNFVWGLQQHFRRSSLSRSSDPENRAAAVLHDSLWKRIRRSLQIGDARFLAYEVVLRIVGNSALAVNHRYSTGLLQCPAIRLVCRLGTRAREARRGV